MLLLGNVVLGTISIILEDIFCEQRQPQRNIYAEFHKIGNKKQNCDRFIESNKDHNKNCYIKYSNGLAEDLMLAVCVWVCT